MKEYKINPPNTQIVMFKVYTVRREYGQKLAGLRCYDSENKVVLSIGWFQDALCTEFALKPHERLTGIEGMWNPSRDIEGLGMIPHQGALLYDVQFRIFNFAK